MKRLVLLLGLVAVGTTASCGSDTPTRPYRYNDLLLINAFTAKELCSCLFVAEMPEDYCLEWTRESPAVATARIDEKNKSVQSGALLLWSRTASWVDEKTGCVLEP